MLGNFLYCNPTKLYFGDESLKYLNDELPKYTLTLPHYQMVSDIYDIFNHICEQYFSGEDDNTSDYISEGLMRSVIHSSRIANRNPQDYEARSNLMWTLRARRMNRSRRKGLRRWKAG